LGVVVAGEPVELAFQPGQRRGPRLGGQPFLLGLVEPFHLAAGLRMVGPGVVELDSKDAEFDFQGDPTFAALFGGEDRPVVGEHPGRDSPGVEGFPEAGHHIEAGGVAADVAAQTEPGVVVENV
jgi:hypothetical protein